jgi:hypothetical protein
LVSEVLDFSCSFKQRTWPQPRSALPTLFPRPSPRPRSTTPHRNRSTPTPTPRSPVLLAVVQLVRHHDALHGRQLGQRADGEAAVDQAIVAVFGGGRVEEERLVRKVGEEEWG